MELEIQNVSKKYGKNKYGVKGLSLTIGTGILGLLGPNGAGKSTLLKMIATVAKPTEGKILLNKNNIVEDPNYMRKQIGFLPQDFGVYPNLNAYEFLKYIAAMKGVGGKKLELRITELLEGLNLMEVSMKPIGTYSGGMKQRLGIAQALLNHPKVVIFDEPTVGLDPQERVRFRNLISDLSNECIVILSSHIVSDIDMISDQIVIMKNGILINHGNSEELVSEIDNKVYESTIDKEAIENFRVDHIVVSTIRKKEKLLVRYISDNPPEMALKKEANLEDAYLYFTHENTDLATVNTESSQSIQS